MVPNGVGRARASTYADGVPDGPLDAALDELYGVEPGEFVATRKRLIAQLRTAGDKDALRVLQAARRPSTSAWALNQLARHHLDQVDALLARSKELLVAQTGAGSSKGEGLRGAMRAHREGLDTAIEAAAAILGARANEKFRAEIAATLRAASTDADVADQLRAGRLVHEVPGGGFPDAFGLTLVPTAPDRGAGVSDGEELESETERDDAREIERERERALAAERAELERRLTKLRTAVTHAEARTAQAQERVDHLGDELERARRELDAAREHSDKASAEADELAAALDAQPDAT